MPKIRRAVVSCFDKTGVVDLARLLREFDVEIISTAGTLHELQEHGVEAIGIAEFTGVQEMLGGRVKSLHPKVHAGLLAVRDNKLHVEQMDMCQFKWIDLVVVNLHPVKQVMHQPGITVDEVMEQIDIGGMAMIRSAAKNFRYVTVVTNPERYSTIMHELRAHEGEVSFKTRFRLAQEAFANIAAYDGLLAEYLRSSEPPEE